MINLIPKEEKKKMIKSLYRKLVVLFLVTTGVSFLIALVSIMPAYFFSSTKNAIEDAKLATQEREPVPLPDQQTLAIIKDLNGKLSLIEQKETNKFIVSQKVINTIILKKVPDVKITDISYQNYSPSDPLKNRKISLQGLAPSREVLLSFRRALEDDTTFQSVDLPISNFVKGSNIQFSLSLILE